MQRQFRLISFLMCFNFYGFSQNLVPNPSFEDYSSCPDNFGEIQRALNWDSYNESPDYYNRCAPSCSPLNMCLGIPQSWYGYQEAYDGNAYVGLGTYDESFPQLREIIGTQLFQPLIPGRKYFVSCYISNAGGYNWFPLHYCDGASNNFGFRFFNNAYSQFNPCPIDNFTHINETAIISDTVNWVKIIGSFIADSAYQYFSMGNFYDALHTDTINIVDSDTLIKKVVYFFVDQVCVSLDSMDCVGINSVHSNFQTNKIEIYPNPFNEKLILNIEFYENVELTIYDILLRPILCQKYSSNQYINTIEFDMGIYYYELKNKTGLIQNGKLLKYNYN
jgi:hypothetical protein